MTDYREPQPGSPRLLDGPREEFFTAYEDPAKKVYVRGSNKLGVAVKAEAEVKERRNAAMIRVEAHRLTQEARGRRDRIRRDSPNGNKFIVEFGSRVANDEIAQVADEVLDSFGRRRDRPRDFGISIFNNISSNGTMFYAFESRGPSRGLMGRARNMFRGAESSIRGAVVVHRGPDGTERGTVILASDDSRMPKHPPFLSWELYRDGPEQYLRTLLRERTIDKEMHRQMRNILEHVRRQVGL